jgi:DNA recombination protein RmuC
MNTVLISLLLVAATANLVLMVALLLRSSSNRAFAKDVREDLRVGREETRAVLDKIRDTFDTRIEDLKQSLDARVKELQAGNERKLEEMRQTVDEKLQGTLEKRLGESFKFVSDRLEMVHKGLGEMQGLATGVGDLKRIFSNVKVRGTWAEVQLAGILEQMLTLDQWDKNVCVKEGSAERVECAIRLPGSRDERGRCMWLPIDSKFPTEDYARLQSAAEVGDPVAVQAATDALLRALRAAAKDIADKYVNPPATTDYAIMFLATEGLYAEALRQPQFVEEMQQKYRVVIAGPTTLSAILSSLRMGFQTVVVEQRASEVWRVLGAVKTEFGKFGGVLDKVARQLGTATRTIEETGTRTRAMEKRLRAVEQMDPIESAAILSLPAVVDAEYDDAEEREEMPGAA